MILRMVVVGNPPLGHWGTVVLYSMAQAAKRGVRVTAASVAAAQRLLAPAGQAATPAPAFDQLAAEPGQRGSPHSIRKPTEP
jgi:hypothetical protein